VCVSVGVGVGVDGRVGGRVTAEGDDNTQSHLRIYKVPNKNPHH